MQNYHSALILWLLQVSSSPINGSSIEPFDLMVGSIEANDELVQGESDVDDEICDDEVGAAKATSDLLDWIAFDLHLELLYVRWKNE